MKVESVYATMLERQKAELKPILARHHKEHKELQKLCQHRETETPFPNKEFVRCINCLKVWELPQNK